MSHNIEESNDDIKENRGFEWISAIALSDMYVLVDNTTR